MGPDFLSDAPPMSDCALPGGRDDRVCHGVLGRALYRRGGLCVLEGPSPGGLLVGPRVGIDYASTRDRRAPYRLAVADSASVSHRSRLRAR